MLIQSCLTLAQNRINTSPTGQGTSFTTLITFSLVEREGFAEKILRSLQISQVSVGKGHIKNCESLTTLIIGGSPQIQCSLKVFDRTMKSAKRGGCFSGAVLRFCLQRFVAV